MDYSWESSFCNADCAVKKKDALLKQFKEEHGITEEAVLKIIGEIWSSDLEDMFLF